MSFSAIIPVGPNTKELHRLDDLLCSLSTFEAADCRAVLIDDTPEPRGLKDYLDAHGLAGSIIHYPRNSPHKGPGAGLCPAVSAGMQLASQDSDIQFAVRLDTDSLVIRPFSNDICKAFTNDRALGIIGTYRQYPDGSDRVKEYATDLARHTKRLCFFRDKAHSKWVSATQGLWGRGRQRRLLLSRAIQNGYQLGDHCQGGGYAVSRTLLNRLCHDDQFKDIQLWRHQRMPEDFMMSIFSIANGLEIADFNQEGQVFGVVLSSLPFSPEECQRRGYAIVHSVKRFESSSEEQIRKEFRHMRCSDGVSD